MEDEPSTSTLTPSRLTSCAGLWDYSNRSLDNNAAPERIPMIRAVSSIKLNYIFAEISVQQTYKLKTRNATNVFMTVPKKTEGLHLHKSQLEIKGPRALIIKTAAISRIKPEELEPDIVAASFPHSRLVADVVEDLHMVHIGDLVKENHVVVTHYFQVKCQHLGKNKFALCLPARIAVGEFQRRFENEDEAVAHTVDVDVSSPVKIINCNSPSYNCTTIASGNFGTEDASYKRRLEFSAPENWHRDFIFTIEIEEDDRPIFVFEKLRRRNSNYLIVYTQIKTHRDIDNQFEEDIQLKWEDAEGNFVRSKQYLTPSSTLKSGDLLETTALFRESSKSPCPSSISVVGKYGLSWKKNISLCPKMETTEALFRAALFESGIMCPDSDEKNLLVLPEAQLFSAIIVKGNRENLSYAHTVVPLAQVFPLTGQARLKTLSP